MPPLTWQDSLQNSLGVYLPSVLGAVAILLIGWIIALIGAAATRRGLGTVRLNERLNTQTASSFDYQTLAGRIVFWLILLLALIGVFSVLRVDGVSGPLTTLATSVLLYLPRLLVAAALALLAWIVATLVRTVVNRTLSRTSLDDKLSKSADMQPLSNTMGNVAYWLVLLLFLPAIVGALQIEGLMLPLANMTSDLLGILPNIFAAVIIGVIGWVIAKAVRGLVTNLLAATGIDKFGASTDATRDMRLSQLGGTLSFILIIVPTLIAALDALRIEAISAPLTRMLDVFMQAIPNVLAAAAILLLSWFIGDFVSQLVTRLLANLGFDQVPARVGLGHALSPAGPVSTSDFDAPGSAPVAAAAGAAATPLTLSGLVGKLAMFFIMLFATVEAAGLLGFNGVHALLEQFIAFGADILLGLVIFAVGYWLADMAASAVERANPQARGMARIARVAILGLVVAMGLRAMGVADDIVNLAFGLVLGAIAVAVALAFGLGGREAAGRIANGWASKHLERKPRD